MALQKIVEQACGTELEITSFREGDVVGMHEIISHSANDRIYLCHDAKSRRGFAEGSRAGCGVGWFSKRDFSTSKMSGRAVNHNSVKLRFCTSQH